MGEAARVKGVPRRKSSGVAKFINVSLGGDAVSLALSAGMQTGACQHAIILIPFALHLAPPSAGVKGRGRGFLKGY